MKAFNRWYGEFMAVAPLYRAAGPLIGIRSETGALSGKFVAGLAVSGRSPADAVAARPDGVTPVAWHQFLTMLFSRPEFILEGWSLAGLVSGGPKVYCPTAAECLALSQVELNVPWGVYRQPFDTFVVVLPDGFYQTPVSEAFGRPTHCVARLDVGLRAAAMNVYGDANRVTLTGRYFWDADSTRTIESHVRSLPPADDIGDDEDAAQDRVKRITINACLLLTQYGCRSLGPANPDYADRLRASLAKRKLPPAVRRANTAALAAMPQLYGFDQHVRLYDREDAAAPAGGTHGPVRPHWRRGHWANQACGEGRAGRRLVFRRPIMVNAHRFAGDHADTRVTITRGLS